MRILAAELWGAELWGAESASSPVQRFASLRSWPRMSRSRTPTLPHFATQCSQLGPKRCLGFDRSPPQLRSRQSQRTDLLGPKLPRPTGQLRNKSRIFHLPILAAGGRISSSPWIMRCWSCTSAARSHTTSPSTMRSSLTTSGTRPATNRQANELCSGTAMIVADLAQNEETASRTQTDQPTQVDARDDRGWTPLMYATFYADEACASRTSYSAGSSAASLFRHASPGFLRSGGGRAIATVLGQPHLELLESLLQLLVAPGDPMQQFFVVWSSGCRAASFDYHVGFSGCNPSTGGAHCHFNIRVRLCARPVHCPPRASRARRPDGCY